MAVERDEVFRIRTGRTPGTLARVLGVMGESGAHIGEIETISITREWNIRDVTVIAPNEEAIDQIKSAIAKLDNVELLEQPVDRVFAVHEGGKLRIEPSVEVRNLIDMREIYTPGVARVSSAIAADATLADRYTWRGNTVAIVTNGSRVLGLGDIGPAAALPVMEGKAVFYAEMVGVNAVPLVLDAATPDEIVDTVRRVAPGFGGIHLEDISTPEVYEVEERLIEALSIPVFHDDQHGTAVVVMAAMLSAARILDRPLDSIRFGQIGLGAAGSAIARLALAFPFAAVNAYDPGVDAVERQVAISAGSDIPLNATADPDGFAQVVGESDVLVLTTGRPDLLDPGSVRPGQVIAALTNPLPEIGIDAAQDAGAAIATDGSIVNNVLAYPGLMKGALEARAAQVTLAMKRAAAEAITEMAPPDQLLPDPLDRSVHAEVASRVAAAAG